MSGRPLLIVPWAVSSSGSSLQGALAVFMQLINETLHEHLYKGFYLPGDILIYMELMEEHVKLVSSA